MTMQALVLPFPQDVHHHPLEMQTVPIPFPAAHEIRIKVQACGVCHTDLHIVEGELTPQKTPLIPGHQVVGIVDCNGSQASRFSLGQRVGVTWLYSSCQACEYCEHNQENLCENAQFSGYHAHGGYAEFMVISEAYAVTLPGEPSALQLAPLLCAGVIGYRSLRLSEVEKGQRLGLYGFGASAHITLQVARHWGCEVYVFTRSAEHQRHALELGAAWVGTAQDTPPHLMDSSITFAPRGWIIHEALRVLRKGGTLAINAVHMTPIPELPYPLLYHERTLRSVANCTRKDAEEFVALAAQIPIKTEVETYLLAEANQVLQRLKDSSIRGSAVLCVHS